MPGTITAPWTATRGRLVTWGYTRNVASLPKRLTSLAIVIALSGSPAVFSACMSLCLQGGGNRCIAHGQPVGGTRGPLGGGGPGRRLSARAS